MPAGPRGGLLWCASMPAVSPATCPAACAGLALPSRAPGAPLCRLCKHVTQACMRVSLGASAPVDLSVPLNCCIVHAAGMASTTSACASTAPPTCGSTSQVRATGYCAGGTWYCARRACRRVKALFEESGTQAQTPAPAAICGRQAGRQPCVVRLPHPLGPVCTSRGWLLADAAMRAIAPTRPCRSV